MLGGEELLDERSDARTGSASHKKRALLFLLHGWLDQHPAEGFDSCDIMAVERADGSWHIEDNWGGDAQGAEGVWNPFDPSDAPPQIYPSQDAAIRRAVAVVPSQK